MVKVNCCAVISFLRLRSDLCATYLPDVGNAFRNYLASTWRHIRLLDTVFLMAAMAVCPAAHAFVTAADFSGLESRIESGSIDSPLGVAVDGNGNVYIAQSSGVLKETLSPDGSGLAKPSSPGSRELSKPASPWIGAGNIYLGINGAVYKETLSDGSYRQSIDSFQCQAARLDRGGRQGQCLYRRQRG